MTPPNRPNEQELAPPPIEQWLLTATQRATGCTVVVDRHARFACSVDRDRRVICLQTGLSLDDLLYLLPRVSLYAMFGESSGVDCAEPFPLRAVPDSRAC
jgi:hypothetical protein